jgi:hypothetical protein
VRKLTDLHTNATSSGFAVANLSSSLLSAGYELVLELLGITASTSRGDTAVLHALADSDVKSGRAMARHTEKNTGSFQLNFTIPKRPH